MTQHQPQTRSIRSQSYRSTKPGGRLLRGTATGEMNRSYFKQSEAIQRQIMNQLEYLPKLKDNKRKTAKSLMDSSKNIEQIILMDSGVFPSIYYKKANLKTVLNQFMFPPSVKGLAPKDERVTLIYQIVLNLFNEITFFAFNILIGEDPVSGSIFVFFSDAQSIPYSKCCNLPVFVELCENGSGRVLCNNQGCESNILAQFLISFEDGKKLWKHLRYFSTASFLDRKLRQRISKIISSGRHRKMNLLSVIHDTSKQIALLLEQPPKEQSMKEQEQPYESSTFLTGAKHNYYKQESEEEINPEPIYSENEPDGTNIPKDLIQQLPNKFLSKTYCQFQSQVSQGIVNEGKVFHKDFELIKRIDEQLLDKRRTKNITAINFPRLMSEFNRDKKKNKKKDEGLEEIKNILNNSTF